MRYGGIKFPIALHEAMQVVVLDLGNVMTCGACWFFLHKTFGGLCSGENPDSSTLKINSGLANKLLSQNFF
jgi:hypothetical protein